MSKVDDLRALREARYDRSTGVQPQSKAVRAQKLAKALADGPAKAVAGPGETACGHRAVGGKMCIRPVGHSEKSHKYPKTPKPPKS